MDLREKLADAIGAADRLAPTDREVHLEMADSVLEVIGLEAEFADFLKRAEQEMAPKLRQSDVAVSLLPEDGEGDAKLWVELGAMICMNKPIVVGRLRGEGIPVKLRLIADAIVNTPEELADAIERLAGKPVQDPRWKWLRHLNGVRSLLFGDGVHTSSGMVKGEHDRTLVASHLNQLQADLGIQSNVEPSA